MKTAKRFMAMAMAMVMCVAMLAACGGNSKDDYMNDLQEIIDMYADFDAVDMDDYEALTNGLASAVKGLNMKTSEGKAIKSDLQDMVDVLEDLVDAIEDYDLEALMELQERSEKIAADAEKHVNAFLEAAEKAGIDESDLDSFDLSALEGLF